MSVEQEIRTLVVPPRSITLWWLGQAGLMVKSPGGKVVVIDPYLTNSCEAFGRKAGYNLARLVPPPLAPADLVRIDLYALTHSHADHLDPETVAGYRSAGGIGPYLAPAETAEKLVELGVPSEQIETIWPNKVYSLGDMSLRATFAIPPSAGDLTHVGYLITIEDGPVLYLTGDTAYHEILATAVAPHQPDLLFTVINPAFSNMGPDQAARLARELNVKRAIPCHYDLFPDNSLPPELFRTNLTRIGLADRYQPLEHGVAFTFSKEEP